MEPDNIDWDNIDSTFAQDDTYENFDAPMWVDLSVSAFHHHSLVHDDAWFCTRDCKHPKTAEDFLKPPTTRSSKVKQLRFASISEIFPFRDRHRRENSSIVESSYERSRRPSRSGSFYEDSENINPNFSAPLSSGRTNKLKKPLIKTNKANPKQMQNGPVECPVKSNKKSQLKSTFSAQNLLGGREILSQISGFCSELKKRLATRGGGGKKGATTSVQSGVSEEEEVIKESVVQHKERVPLLVVKDSKKGHTHTHTLE